MITNTRRAPRLQVPELVQVRDQMTGTQIGRSATYPKPACC